MKITEVRIFPTESRDGKLKAFATMTFDDWFVVRNVKIIQGNNGLFVAMPSRKAMDSCPKCRTKNARGSKYCNECGGHLSEPRPDADHGKKQGSHMDIAHPISQDCRVYIQDEILKAYEAEHLKKAEEGSSYTPASDHDLNAAAAEHARETEPAVPVEEEKAEETLSAPEPETKEEAPEPAQEPEPETEPEQPEERRPAIPKVEGDQDIAL